MRKNPKLFLLQVRKTLVDKTCGKIGRTLCMTYNLFYYIGKRALADVIKQGEEVMDTREGQSSSAPATADSQWKLFSNCGNYFFKEKHQFLKKISLKYQ